MTSIQCVGVPTFTACLAVLVVIIGAIILWLMEKEEESKGGN